MLRVWISLLGIYLAYYHIAMMPYVLEVYGDQGLVRQLFLQPDTATTSWFDFLSSAMTALGIVSGLLLCFNFWTRLFAGLSLVSSVYFYYLSGYNISPEWPFVNWMLAAVVLFPADSFRARREEESLDVMAKLLRWGAWLAMGFGYLAPGISKLRSYQWQSGRALEKMVWFDSALRPEFRGVLTELSSSTLTAATYGAIGVELASCVLIFFRATRWMAWSALVAMNVFILIFFNLTQVSLGMLLFHGLFIVLYAKLQRPYV